MLRTILNPLIDRMEERTGADMGHMRALAEHRPGLAARVGLVTPLLDGAHAAPGALHVLARLGAVQAVDCGPCTRIEVALADRDEIPAETLAAALGRGDARLDGDEALAHAFGAAVGSGSPDAARLGDEIRASLGEEARVELAVSAAAALFFPALKRGLGLSRSCSVTEIPLEVGAPGEEG